MRDPWRPPHRRTYHGERRSDTPRRAPVSSGVPSQPPIAASCRFRSEFAGCAVFNAYNGGALVGAFHLAGQRFVAAGGHCPSDYLAGRQVAINKIASDGAV